MDHGSEGFSAKPYTQQAVPTCARVKYSKHFLSVATRIGVFPNCTAKSNIVVRPRCHLPCKQFAGGYMGLHKDACSNFSADTSSCQQSM